MNTLLSIFLAVSGSSLIGLIIWIVVLAVIFWLVNWAIGYIGVGEPFNKIIRVVLAIVIVVLLINVLLGLVGKPFIRF